MVWSSRKHRVEKLCESQVADTQVPCTLRGSISKDPKSHVVASPVILKSILISLVSSDGSRSRAQLLQALAAEPVTAVRTGGDREEEGSHRHGQAHPEAGG